MGLIDTVRWQPYYARTDLAWTELEHSVLTDPISEIEGRDDCVNVLLTCRFIYLAGAGAGDRTARIQYVDDNGRVLYSFVSPSVQTATQQITYLFGIGLTTEAVAASHVTVALPDIQFPLNGNLFVNTVGWKVGDSISALAAEWIHIPTGPAVSAESLVPAPLLL